MSACMHIRKFWSAPIGWLRTPRDANVRVVEVDVDTKAYDEGHVPGAIAWAWNTQLCDTVVRDILPKAQFEALMTQSGISNDTTVVLYGDNNNWFAAWAFWQMKIYGHKDVRIMDGGRKKWLAEGRDLDTNATMPAASSTPYKATEPDHFHPRVSAAGAAGAESRPAPCMIDVRSPQEFTGEILAPPGLPETCQRGGHIPGARSVPWGKACNDDGTFKSAGRIEKLYGAEGVSQSKPVIAYCRIGERSSHTWFVLKYLLGIGNVMNYDGSWTEWGNLVGAPVEKGAARSVVRREAGKLQRAQRGGRRLAGESDDLSARRQVAHQGGQRIAGRGAGAHRGGHARRRRGPGIGPRQGATLAHQAPSLAAQVGVP